MLTSKTDFSIGIMHARGCTCRYACWRIECEINDWDISQESRVAIYYEKYVQKAQSLPPDLAEFLRKSQEVVVVEKGWRGEREKVINFNESVKQM